MAISIYSFLLKQIIKAEARKYNNSGLARQTCVDIHRVAVIG